jgi:predicted RNA-binding Zn-ribbon protein involved in translation (DUF1610 family)
MSYDLRAEEGYSNDKLRALATAVRKAFGVDQCERVDIVACLKTGWVQTVGGRKRLVFEIVADEEMGGDDATAETAADWARITCKAYVAEMAARVGGRPAMTLAHELGHVVLNHRRAVMARATGANASTRPKFLRPFESAETQADKFAAYFLIKEEFAAKYRSAEAISIAFGVSLQAAQVCFKKNEDKSARKRVIAGFDALLEELRKGNAPKSRHDNSSSSGRNANNDNIHIVFGICPRCRIGRIRRATGNRFECVDCGYVGDHLADGDSFGTLI